MRGRAIRRHHYRVAKARARRQASRFDLLPTPDWLGRHAHTRVPCSCWMCGNQRKYYGERTRQELLAEEAQRSRSDQDIVARTEPRTRELPGIPTGPRGGE